MKRVTAADLYVFRYAAHVDLDFACQALKILAEQCALSLGNEARPPAYASNADERRPEDLRFLPDGVETLGTYFPAAADLAWPTIEIFPRRIQRFAEVHAFSPTHVQQVVLVHELAHYVTHRGMRGPKYWKDFPNAGRAHKEKLAQIATWLFLTKAGLETHLHAFWFMSQRSPQEYQSWEKFVGQRSPEEVREQFCYDLMHSTGREVTPEEILDAEDC